MISFITTYTTWLYQGIPHLRQDVATVNLQLCCLLFHHAVHMIMHLFSRLLMHKLTTGKDVTDHHNSSYKISSVFDGSTILVFIVGVPPPQPPPLHQPCKNEVSCLIKEVV